MMNLYIVERTVITTESITLEAESEKQAMEASEEYEDREWTVLDCEVDNTSAIKKKG